ncbi:MAG: hypothetical protein J7M34_00290 [Anaerolineae bacterium]|nr:hypothetical protein [Anaerolineae bacterium]
MKAKRFALMGLVFVILGGLAVIVWAYADFYNTFRVHDPFDQTDPTCDYDARASLDMDDWWAWKLQADADWRIDGMELYLSYEDAGGGAPTEPITLGIYTTSLPFWSGPPIATGTIGPGGIPAYSYHNAQTFTITLSSPVTLTSGMTFWLALSTDQDWNDAYYDLYLSPGSDFGCSASRPTWLIEQDDCYPGDTCYTNATDGGDIMPFAVVGAEAGGTPTSTPTSTPTPTPTVKATSTPQATPTPVRYTQIYAAEVATPELRPVLIVHYNP